MPDLASNKDLLNIQISITASPQILFDQEGSSLRGRAARTTPGSFSIHLDMAVQYESLSRVANDYMEGKRFDLTNGLLATYIVVNDVKVAGGREGHLYLEVHFTGSFKGTIFLRGKPVFKSATKMLELQNTIYDLQTNNLLLKGAKWLLADKLEAELKKASQFDLSPSLQTAQIFLSKSLNKDWTSGISSSGSMNDLSLESVQALPQHLLVKTTCEGNLSLLIDEKELSFNH